MSGALIGPSVQAGVDRHRKLVTGTKPGTHLFAVGRSRGPHAHVCVYCEPHHAKTEEDRLLLEAGAQESHGMCEKAHHRVLAENGLLDDDT